MVIQSVTWLAGRDPAGSSSPAQCLHSVGSRRPRKFRGKTISSGRTQKHPITSDDGCSPCVAPPRIISASSPDWPNSQALLQCDLLGLLWLSSSRPAFRWRPCGRSAGTRSWSVLRRGPFRDPRLPTRARLNGASTLGVRPRPRTPLAGFKPASMHHGPLRTSMGCFAGLSPSPVSARAHRVEQEDFTVKLLESLEPPSNRTSPSPGIRLYPVDQWR